MWTSTPFRAAADRLRRGARHHRAQGGRRDDGELRARPRSEPARARGAGGAARAARQGAGSREVARRGGDGGQERVSREHEPRDPHAAERDPRHDDAGAADEAVGRAAGLPRRRSSRRRESLLAIVNDILDFSKIEARRLDLEHAEFDLRETVGDAAKLLALRAQRKGARARLPHRRRRARGGARRRRTPPAGAAERSRATP